MQLCPTCGNPYEDGVKYCPCCGNAIAQILPANPEDTTFLYCVPDEPAPIIEFSAGAKSAYTLTSEGAPAVCESPAGKSAETMPAAWIPAPDVMPSQPIWLAQSPDSKALQDIEEELSELPDADDYKSPRVNATFKPSDEDIFDEAANAASEIFSNMSPRAKRMVISIIIGTLLSLIPFLYTSCTHSDLIKTIFP